MLNMKDPILEVVHQKPEEDKTNDMIMEHDIKIQQLETRLNSLENLVNRIIQNKPPYWSE